MEKHRYSRLGSGLQRNYSDTAQRELNTGGSKLNVNMRATWKSEDSGQCDPSLDIQDLSVWQQLAESNPLGYSLGHGSDLDEGQRKNKVGTRSQKIQGYVSNKETQIEGLGCKNRSLSQKQRRISVIRLTDEIKPGSHIILTMLSHCPRAPRNLTISDLAPESRVRLNVQVIKNVLSHEKQSSGNREPSRSLLSVTQDTSLWPRLSSGI